MISKLGFKGKWRSYQARVLDDLNRHLSDDKLHIVAAPGAGKTILGLEVLCRIGKPCLILAPTLTIKYQWVSRLKESFTDDASLVDQIVSCDILNPKMITVSTYQGLLAGLCGRSEEDVEVKVKTEEEEEKASKDEKTLTRLDEKKAQALIQKLKKEKITVLCFDEAHHLRKEWWKALDYLMDELEPQRTLSLTATPPYDVNQAEWKRYETLCGPIDAAISIPELVKNGDLCPHQDLIYFAQMRPVEKEAVEKYERNACQLLVSLGEDKEFAEEIRKLSIWTRPQDYKELLWEDFEFYLALMSFLHQHQIEIPKAFLQTIGADEKGISRLSINQTSIILNGFIFKHRENFPSLESFIEKYHKMASNLGLVEKQVIYLDNSPKMSKVMARSLGKLDAIDEIVKVESRNLKDQLRMVILADYIKYESFSSRQEILGVVPIFQRIRDLDLPFVRLGMLTGKIILIPVGAKEKLSLLMKEDGVPTGNVSFKHFKPCLDYVEVVPKEKNRSKIIYLITQMFNEGDLNVLVGTQSLLGEGWDAPSINSLILSSTVTSYMLSNQMRGRAIRIDKNNPKKVSHIWHLVNIRICSFLEQFSAQKAIEGDFIQIDKRFQGYEAPMVLDPYEITYGMDRCLFGKRIEKFDKMGQGQFEALTKKALSYPRANTALSWEKGLITGTGMGVGCTKKALPTEVGIRNYSLVDEYVSKLLACVGICSYLSLKLASAAGNMHLMLPVWGIGTLWLLPSTLKVIRTGKPEGMLKQISLVILETLFEADIIDTNPRVSSLCVEKSGWGNYVVKADTLNQRDRAIFLGALKEFLSPIENPRYLVVRKRFLPFFKQVDYHAMPTVLGMNKKTAVIFKEKWKRRIGPCNIIYTRGGVGRDLLLKARYKAYSDMQKKEESK